jgi:hypothetical protein
MLFMSAYSEDDVLLGIEKVVSIRIMEQFYLNARELANSFDSTKEKLFDFVIRTIVGNSSGLILGIDEVNNVFHFDPHEFKKLFSLVTSKSCSSQLFVVPIFAGMVIGPIQSVVAGSRHPALHIPLPLLSFESCQKGCKICFS